MILLRPGRAKFNGSKNTSRIWIESTVCRRCSGGEYFPRNHNVGSSRTDSKVYWRPTVRTWALQTQIISCQCTTTWKAKGSKEQCEYNSQTVMNYARKFPRGHWSFLESGSEEKWYGTYTDKPDESWDKVAEDMMINFSDSGHPIFRASSAFERGELRSNGRGKKSIHFNGSEETIELILRTIISVNQLSIYGAIADLCDEVPKDIRAPGKPAAPDHLEKMEIPTGPSTEETQTNAEQRRNLVQEHKRNSNNCQKTRNYPNYVLMRVWSLSKQDNTSSLLIQKKDNRWNIYAENTTVPRNEKEDSCERMDSQEYENRPSLNIKSLRSRWSIQYRSSNSFPSLFQDKTASWVRIVNGADKYVTESMLTTEEEGRSFGKPIAKQGRRQKPTVTWLQFQFLFLKGNRSTLKHNDHTIKSVLKCQKAITRLLRHDQTVLRGSDEWPSTKTSSKSAGRRSLMLLRNGHLKIGYQHWQKEEEQRKYFNIAWIQTLPINSCTFEQFRDIQVVVLLILHCKTMYRYRKDLPSTSTTSGTPMNWIQ